MEFNPLFSTKETFRDDDRTDVVLRAVYEF